MEQQVIPQGYKQTELGMIPEDWKEITIGEFSPLQRGFDLTSSQRKSGTYPVVYSNGIVNYHNTFQVRGSGVITGRSGTIGKVHFVEEDYWPHNTTLWVKKFNNADPKFVFYLFGLIGFERFSSGSGVPTLNRNDAHCYKITVPCSVTEQTAIATALSDVDSLIASLDKLIAKKQAIKTATMQQLLTGKTRLPAFSHHPDGQAKGTKQSDLGEIPEDWDVLTLDEATTCLDNVRVPLNEAQRNKMKGDIPYCGANGVVGWVNDYVIDADIILIAEDGGYFDEYATRPIAYSMSGKCWVNNHAHVLQAKASFSQSYVFYSLVHKDIQKYIASGTRAKLNRGELVKIEIIIPSDKNEQSAIAVIFSDMDAEIQTLQQRLSKTQQLKQGMMQELLTGKTRLI